MARALSLCLALIQIGYASPQPGSRHTWLRPSDSAYEKSIQEAFDGTANLGPFNDDKSGVHQIWVRFSTSRPGRNSIMFYSPLHCAQLLADDARQKKGPKPTVISVRRSCDGNLFAVVSYTSGTKADSFPVLVKHDGVELRPRSDKLAVEPIVSRRQTTSFQTEYTYSYRDQLFTFNLLDPWTYKVTVQYVLPETGDATEVPLDLSVFTEDEADYSSGY